MKLTSEQEAAVSAVGDRKIEAVAGSGKTASLVAYARLHPKKRILYLAFNRTVKEAAEQRFARLGLNHVQVTTAHGLAYRAVRDQAKFRNLQVSPGIKLTELVKLLNLDKRIKDYAVCCKLAGHINQCLIHFCNSSLLKFTDSNYLTTLAEPEAVEFAQKYEDSIMQYTKYWMEQMYAGQTPMTHDFYLKLFHYLNPELPFDAILFDEGQDASPVMLELFIKQKAEKIIVGDRHQQIYGWRFAVNALEMIDLPVFRLTNSFRFGENIARAAGRVLELKKLLGETEPFQIQGLVPSKAEKVKAVIARTNVKLLEDAIENLSDPKAIFYFEGGLNGYTFASQNASIYDALNLYLGKKKNIKSDLIRQFGSVSELKEYAKVTLDNEMEMICQIVEKYKADLGGLLVNLRDRETEDKSRATYIFSTVHKAKGMEYDLVSLTDDYITEAKIKSQLDAFKKNTGEKEDSPGFRMLQNKLKEEINILYVAVTRAKAHLMLPDELFQMMAGKE